MAILPLLGGQGPAKGPGGPMTRCLMRNAVCRRECHADS